VNIPQKFKEYLFIKTDARIDAYYANVTFAFLCYSLRHIHYIVCSCIII